MKQLAQILQDGSPWDQGNYAYQEISTKWRETGDQL